MCLIADFFNGRGTLKHINTTFNTLIPKFKEALHIRDFHPISRLNTIYIIVSKLLTSMLASMHPS